MEADNFQWFAIERNKTTDVIEIMKLIIFRSGIDKDFNIIQ
jgi:hypothetical protein